MDGIRSKVQDPEERKKTQKKILLPSTFSIAISIAMVSVGTKVNRELNTFIGKIKYLSAMVITLTCLLFVSTQIPALLTPRCI